jgi:hypothetical protein
MKLVKSMFLASLVMMLAACQSLGIPAADTFNKKVYTGYATVVTVANTATTLLNAGKLSNADAQNVLEQATNAKTALDIAKSVHETTPDLGDAKLVAALQILTALQQYVGVVK